MSAKVQINILVEGAVHARLQKMATQAGYPISTYARLLFDAAFSARCKPTGDAALDAAVAAALRPGPSAPADVALPAELAAARQTIERLQGEGAEMAVLRTKISELSASIVDSAAKDRELAAAYAALDEERKAKTAAVKKAKALGKGLDDHKADLTAAQATIATLRAAPKAAEAPPPPARSRYRAARRRRRLRLGRGHGRG